MENQLSVVLDKLLATAKEYASKGVEKGQDFTEEKLNIPETGAERDAMVDGLKKGALASAVLLGLLGTKTGRKLTGKAIKIGSIAALGTAAYKGYQNWKATGDPLSASASQPLHKLEDDEANQRSLLIIKALVAAAHADGHVDDQEIQAIRRELIEMHLPQELAIQVEDILESPMTAQNLAALADSSQAASEVYLATRLIIGEHSSEQEQAYLVALSDALAIDEPLQSSLDSQV